MPRSNDIEFAIAEILDSQRQLHLVRKLEANMGTLRGRDANVLVRTYEAGFHHIESAASVIVDDTVDGGIGQPGSIEAGEHVVLSKDVFNQHVAGHTVLVGGKIYDSTICSVSDMNIMGNVTNSQLTLGELNIHRTEIAQIERQIQDLAEQNQRLSRQLAHESSQLNKMSSSAGFNLSLQVGRLIQHEAKKLTLNLSHFYEQVNKETDDEIRVALTEFFNRGVMGVLSRTNRAQFAGSPAKEQLFTKVLASLRQFVLSTFQRDMLVRRLTNETEVFKEQVASYADPERRLCLKGELSRDSEVCFCFPLVILHDDGRATLTAHAIRLALRQDAQGMALVQTHPDGSEETIRVRDRLEAVEFYLGTKNQQPTVRVVPMR